MHYPLPSEVLRHVREAKGASQATLAKAMGTVASVLSKLEKTEHADPDIADRYLSAMESPLAEEVRNYYSRDWLAATPPSFLHPDRESLWEVDQALKRLEAFEAERQDPILRGPIDLLRSELLAAQTYLLRRDHAVAWVGDIGVGKTTALTHAVGLLVGDGRSGRRPAFPVGPGRTTVCETAIRWAPTYGVLVDALEEEDVVRLTRDMVSSLAPGAAGVGVSAEIARLLRNMSGMRISTLQSGEETITTDPLAKLLAAGSGVDEVTDRTIGAMALAERTERQVILPEGSEDGLQWVSRQVSAINAGQDSRFGVPRRITVLMPSKNLNTGGQVLSVVDTRGVEGVTQRPDLTTHGEDSRTLVVLCTKFADAPNATVQRHLRDAVDARTDAAERGRQCILVLPRGDEPLEVPGFDGPVATREEGYAVRRSEIDLALVNAQLPKTPTYFFDARSDDADKIWSRLRGQISQMRAAYAQLGQQAAHGVENLIKNVDSVRTVEARRDIEGALHRLLETVRPLQASVRPPHQNLVEQIAIGHHSSIAASVYRRGDWENFQFAHILGIGVRIDANLRTMNDALRVEHRLMDFESQYEDMEAVLQTVRGLKGRLSEGRQEFLSAARTIGRDVYERLLARAGEVWTESAERYGRGAGYKKDVASVWRNWFETSEEARSAAQEVNDRVEDAWAYWVIDPLARAIRTDVI